MSAVIFTIGHSTRTAEELGVLLEAHGIRQIADVRRVPRSARHPHFGGDALAAFLAGREIGYRHFPALGGLRRPLSDSVNSAWLHAGFRGYADHMQTDEFRQALAELVDFAEPARTSVLCAEAAWWKCHRRLLADALIFRGVSVRHILSAAEPKPHELSDFAREDHGRVTYPGLV